MAHGVVMLLVKRVSAETSENVGFNLHLGELERIVISSPVLPHHTGSKERSFSSQIETVQVGIVACTVPPGAFVPHCTWVRCLIVVLVSSAELLSELAFQRIIWHTHCLHTVSSHGTCCSYDRCNGWSNRFVFADAMPPEVEKKFSFDSRSYFMQQYDRLTTPLLRECCFNDTRTAHHRAHSHGARHCLSASSKKKTNIILKLSLFDMHSNVRSFLPNLFFVSP